MLYYDQVWGLGYLTELVWDMVEQPWGDSQSTLLATYEASSRAFIFIERIEKQNSRSDTADGLTGLGLDVKILVDL
ncbi:hypothetical protein TNCV_2673311 [Trichonephila clavipes]|nr:hypothetical protein TNCV_2673311 [Trichonephila clavipes]